MATFQLFDEEVFLSLTALGKFDEIFQLSQLSHILRIIYDLDDPEISAINIFKSSASNLVT